MAEIKHNLLGGYLNSLASDNSSTATPQDVISPEKIPPLFFIWGEEFLCRKVFDSVYTLSKFLHSFTGR